jgi:hypothetical protein
MTEAEYYLSAYGPQKSWDEEGYNYFEDDPGFPCLADTDRNLHLIRGSEGYSLTESLYWFCTHRRLSFISTPINEGPVHEGPANSLGLHHAIGNAWEWCEDAFSGLPGFKTHDLYMDYSVPSFDGKHYMLKGGSFISTGKEKKAFICRLCAWCRRSVPPPPSFISYFLLL